MLRRARHSLTKLAVGSHPDAFPWQHDSDRFEKIPGTPGAIYPYFMLLGRRSHPFSSRGQAMRFLSGRKRLRQAELSHDAGALRSDHRTECATLLTLEPGLP